MPVPISQMWTVATYVLKQKIAGRKRYPFVLMLEPLFRCNLACAGCGKIQYPAHILKKELSPEECFKAVDECGTPMVSIPGGEPLMHPQEVHLFVHQRVAPEGKAGSLQAQQIFDVFGSHGRPARTS
jgi:MoaA/NifB/PqqE/SkfB family radical SAM enzyme